MFRSLVRPAVGGRSGLIALGLVLGMLSASVVRAQQQPAAPAAQAAPAQNPYLFKGDGAITLNFIKPEKVADFEMVMGKLKEALAKSENPTRKQQAASWRVFKAAEPGPNGSVLYISVIDPVAKGADYSVVQILNEAFPQDVQALYKTYSEAYVSQNLINLTLFMDLK